MPEGKQYWQAVEELVRTEQTFVHRLNVIYEVYKLQAEAALREQERRLLFGNLDEILALNGQFLVELQAAMDSSASLSQLSTLISAYLQLFKSPYIQYCCNHRKANEYLMEKERSDHQFQSFLRDCLQDQECSGLDLASFLLEPVQRIARYPLLLRQILSMADLEDREHVGLALQRAQSIMDSINHAIKYKESEERMMELNMLLRWTEFKVVLTETTAYGVVRRLHVSDIACLEVETGNDALGFLFSDLFLLADPQTSAVIGLPWPIEQLEFDGSAIAYGRQRAILKDPTDTLTCVAIRECLDTAQQEFYSSLDHHQILESSEQRFCGLVRCKFSSAKNLFCLPSNYPRDPLPFVRASLQRSDGSVYGAMCTACSSGSNPVWERDNQVEMMAESLLDSLKIELLDRRPFAMPVPLGRYAVALGDFADYCTDKEIEQTVQLQGVPRGSLTCTILFTLL